MTLELFADTPVIIGQSWSVLSAPYTAGATVLAVVSNTPYPTADPTLNPATVFRVRIDNEILLVTDNRTLTWTVAGAQEGSTAANHAAGALVVVPFTKGSVAGVVAAAAVDATTKVATETTRATTAEAAAQAAAITAAATDATTKADAAQAAATAASQPLDSDLTAIAALTTTTFGRALLALADAAAGRTAFGLGSAATQASSAFDAAGLAAAAQAASQPVDSDLTAIAALTTTSYGRAFLALADAAAARTALALGTIATHDATEFLTTTTASATYVALIKNSTTPEAYGAVGNTSGHDDAPAVQAAIAAVVAACIADGSYVCEVVFNEAKVYYANRAPVQDTTTNHSYAQIALPYYDWIAEGVTTPLVTLILRTNAPKQANTVTFVEQPCAIKSTPTTGQGNVTGVGCPSVLGGPAWNNTNAPAFPHFSGIHLVVDGVNIIAPPNPPFIGLDASGIDGLELPNFATYVPIAGGFGNPDPAQATHPQAWGVQYPKVSNGGMCRGGSVYVSGFYSGVRYGEHVEITRYEAYANRIALEPVPGAQASSIKYFDDVHNQYGIAQNGGTDGSAPQAITTASSLPPLTISMWNMETASGRSADIFDTNNKLVVDANYLAAAFTAPNVIGGSGCDVRDINDQITARSKWGIATTIQPVVFSRTSDASANSLANNGFYLRAVDGGRGLTKFFLQVGTASGNISIAGYKRSGKGGAAVPTGGQVITTGAIACPASGYAEVTPAGSGFAILAGDFIGISTDNTTATIATALGMASSLTFAVPGVSYSQGAAHPLPATPSSLGTGNARLYAVGAR